MCARSLPLLLASLALCVLLSSAQLYYDYEGREESIRLTQLWAEGYWKRVRKTALTQPRSLKCRFRPTLNPLRVTDRLVRFF